MIHTRFAPEYNGYLIYRVEKKPDGSYEYLDAFNRTKTVKQGEEGPWWALLDPGDCIELVNSLKQAGLIVLGQRETFLEGKMEATEKHLEDMRQMALLSPSAGRPGEED